MGPFWCTGLEISGQVKKPITKPTPKTISPNKTVITVIEATTKEGKTVILKSDNTWEYSKNGLTASTPTSEVKKCSLSLNDAPLLRGFKVGMSEAEVRNILGVSDDRLKMTPLDLPPVVWPNGVVSHGMYDHMLRYSPSYYSTFLGIEKLTVNFYSGFLYSLEIKYKPSSGSLSDEQLKQKLVEGFSLPLHLWSVNSINSAEFSVSVNKGAITVTSLIIEKAITENEERKKKYFRP